MKRFTPILFFIVLIVLISLVRSRFAHAQAVQPQDGENPPFVILRRSRLPPPPGQSGDVLVAADLENDTLARRAAEILNDPQSYPHFALRLRRLANNYLEQQGFARPDEPTYLFISDRQGGFPAQGFWLETPGGALLEKQGVAFVDMAFDESDLAGERWGGFAEIFAHELGHIILRDLAGQPTQKYSNAVHFVTVRTDPWYAFDEGWGEHFQPAALAASGNSAMLAQRDTPWPTAESGWYARFAGEQAQGCFFCPANLSLLFWQGRSEQQLRDGAVRANLFAHQSTLPASLQSERRPYYDAMLYRDLVPPDADAPLKNGSQMLASEGVIATLFYRLVNDRRLQNTWREAEFYQAFEYGSEKPQMRFTPQENVYLKLFAVFATTLDWDSGTGAPPAIQIIEGYARRYPDEAEAMYDVFLEVTHGVTVAPTGADLESLRQRLLNGEAGLHDNLGPALWLSNSDFKGGFGIFRYFPLRPPYTFDLNAADAADLRSVPGVDQALAARIIQAREAHGHFHSLDELAHIEGMTPELRQRFDTMQADMRQQLQETQQDDPGLASLMLWLLIGSYLAAAIFQAGGVIAIGTGVYLLVHAIRRLARLAPVPAESPRASCLQIALSGAGNGLGVALIAFAASLLLYAGNAPISAWSMAVAGLFTQGWRYFTANDRRAWAWQLAAWVAVFAVTGWLY
ncbi:MAG: ComEA family DNA-binding protein [Chloroflexota bacterium]